MVNLIVAYNKNFAIAENGKIPWYISEDFKHFKRTTKFHSIIMGRKTFDSLPKKPLPGRLNIVLTRDPGPASEKFEGVYFTDDLGMAFRHALMINPNRDIFIIGGEQIYNLALDGNYIEKVIASEVDDDTPGDRFFPDLSYLGWGSKEVQEHEGFKIVEFISPHPPSQIQMVSAESIGEPPVQCCDSSE